MKERQREEKEKDGCNYLCQCEILATVYLSLAQRLETLEWVSLWTQCVGFSGIHW